MLKGLETQDHHLIKTVKLHPDSELKLADYYTSFLNDYDERKKFVLPAPGKLSSKILAAEMAELYAMAISRDVSFCCYHNSSTIKRVLKSLNQHDIIKHLPDQPLDNYKITPSTIFRGDNMGEVLGPYISQLLLLNIPMGAHIIEQKYHVHPKRREAINKRLTTEWGRNHKEMIKIQNGKLSELPDGPKHDDLDYKYIYNGRSLGELVHGDPVFQIYHNAALILNKIGAKYNDGFHKFENCGRFVQGYGLASLLCSIAECSKLALSHAWFWKWKKYRKLRPEVTSLWIDNVKNYRKSNKEYDLDEAILKSNILDDIKEYHSYWGNDFNHSYTLPLQYKEGSPTHPSYPAGHAVVAGACCTILKIYFDDEQKWKDMKVFDDPHNVIIPDKLNDVVIASHEGTKLKKYEGYDKHKLTIGHEVNKLASNVALGRDWAGVHYRTDGTKGILLGELVAINYMKTIMKSWHPKHDSGRDFSFTKFNGERHTF